MRKVVFIGSRLSALQCLGDFPELILVKIFIQEDSLLSRKVSQLIYLDNIEIRVFKPSEKQSVIDEIASIDFDILVSNGCPIILPVTQIQKEGQLFINIHPTLLPELKGKTPLSGVFMTHQTAIGATMHYIDDGIDTGAIISQTKVALTSDIDQGLVYKISFDLESDVFVKGMKLLEANNFVLSGVRQAGEGSYFNRTDDLQTIDINKDPTDLIIGKVKSFGIKGQGSNLEIEGTTYKVYSTEKIINKYLLQKYGDLNPGVIAFYYDDKLVIKTIDGMIKIVSYEIFSIERI